MNNGVSWNGSKQAGRRKDRRAVVGVYAAATVTDTTERIGVFKLLHFLFNGWKPFLRSVLLEEGANADEFKQISTTLNYYTIVRQT